tara:strand:+ start:49 stop:246 length:198 start_codon:yes stop_codon:yes gene_type:complete
LDVVQLAQAIYRIIDDRKFFVQEQLLFDQIKNMEQYREMMGNLSALNHVEQELKSLLDKQERLNE